MDEFFCVTLRYGCWNIAFLNSVKREIDFAIGLYGGEQIAVHVGLRGSSVFPIARKRVALRASRADNPARQDAAVFAPVIGIENSVHEIVRVARKDVDALVLFVAH